MENRGTGEVVEAELVDDIPDGPTGLSTHRQVRALAKLDAMIGGAVQRALDERVQAEQAEKAKDESTPEARAEYWQSITENTRRGYEADWRRFEEWCAGREIPAGLAGVDVIGLDPAELEAAFVAAKPDKICAYVQDMYDRELKLTTITRAIAAIGRIHERYGKPKPTRAMKVRDKLAHLRRASVDDRRNRVKKASAITRDHYTAIMATFGERKTRRQLRNAAIMSLWFNVGARRDEIRHLRREDVRIVRSEKLQADVLVVHIFKSKTDQEGVGVDIPIQRRSTEALCALRAVQAWLEATERELGEGESLFPRIRRDVIYRESMSLRSLDLLVKKAAVEAGFEEHEFSTHSLRAGCATFLLDEGVELTRVQDHLRHKDSKTTRGYYRPENRLDRDPMDGLL